MYTQEGMLALVRIGVAVFYAFFLLRALSIGVMVSAWGHFA